MKRDAFPGGQGPCCRCYWDRWRCLVRYSDSDYYVESAASSRRNWLTALTTAVVPGSVLLAHRQLFLKQPLLRPYPGCDDDGAILTSTGASSARQFALLTLAGMPFTFTANGIAFGFISYSVIKLLSGKGRSPLIIHLLLLFILRFIYLA